MRRKSVALPGVAVTLIACPWGHYDARPCKRFVRSYVATICRPLASVHRFSGRTFCSSGGINPGEEMHFSRFRRKASGTGEGPRLRRLVAGGLGGFEPRTTRYLKHSGPTGCRRSPVPGTFVSLLGTSFLLFQQERGLLPRNVQDSGECSTGCSRGRERYSQKWNEHPSQPARSAKTSLSGGICGVHAPC